MEQPVLTNPETFPDDKLIFEHIGNSRKLWISMFKYIDESHPELNRNWKYYNNEKSWLMKVTLKSKTIFWLSIIKGAFRTTFYFTDKAGMMISGSTIDKELKEQFNSKSGLRGVTIVFRNSKDIDSLKELIMIKLSLK